MIAGLADSESYLSDVNYVSTQNNNNVCDPTDLDYTVYGHASVATDLGILTCEGWTGSSTPKCTFLTKEGPMRLTEEGSITIPLRV